MEKEECHSAPATEEADTGNHAPATEVMESARQLTTAAAEARTGAAKGDHTVIEAEAAAHGLTAGEAAAPAAKARVGEDTTLMFNV